MVRGLDRFRDCFNTYNDRYVLIGGAACSLAMEDAGLAFRATKDLDIVLCVEALDTAFVKVFWDFIKAGGYKNRQQSTGKKLFYRFHSPEDEAYPVMLELFSRSPDTLDLGEDSHLTPIPVDEEMSSLSAILLDKDYYGFIHSGRREIDGLSLVGAEHLVPLKARAWLDMLARVAEGEKIDSKDIRKHRNDIFRLYQLLSAKTRIELPDVIKADMNSFIEKIKDEEGAIDLKSFGLRDTKLDDVLGDLRTIYGL